MFACCRKQQASFGGGFPREPGLVARQAAQRAIFHVQRELESLVGPDGTSAITLCDRGTLDGCAYWPGIPAELLEAANTNRVAELARYAAVLHLRTPTLTDGYNHQNALRIESAEDAAAIDERIAEAWKGHPRSWRSSDDPARAKSLRASRCAPLSARNARSARCRVEGRRNSRPLVWPVPC
jgi:hypothetical protein